MAGDSLTAGAAARRLGVAVTTLRTWHQRYGLGPSQHAPGQHRRYTPQDMDRLEVMRRLTAQGVPPAEAAAWAARMPEPTDLVTAVRPSTFDPHPITARDGGGATIPVGRAGPAARGLARAASRLDGHALRDIIELHISERGVVDTWEHVIMPVLIGIGLRYQETRRFIEVEHIISRSVTEALSVVPRPAGVARVLLTTADEEQHTLPLEALAAALAEQHVPCRFLGARVPASALSDAVDRTGPSAVVLWSQIPRTADIAQLNALVSAPHRPLLVAAAGPGWPAECIPAEVALVTSLPDAVRVVTAVARP